MLLYATMRRMAQGPPFTETKVGGAEDKRGAKR
jgi:hypothetical protein